MRSSSRRIGGYCDCHARAKGPTYLHTYYPYQAPSAAKLKFNSDVARLVAAADAPPHTPIYIMDAGSQNTTRHLLRYFTNERLTSFTMCSYDFDLMQLPNVAKINVAAEELYSEFDHESVIVIDDGTNEAAKTLARAEILLTQGIRDIWAVFNVCSHRKSQLCNFTAELERTARGLGYKCTITPRPKYRQTKKSRPMSPYWCEFHQL
jgi:hypothetical protein